MGKLEGEKGAIFMAYGKGIGSGGIVALGMCLALLFLGALLLSRGMVTTEYLYQMTLIGCAVGSFTGGRWAIGMCHNRALIVGLLVGVVLMLLCTVIGMLLFQGHPSSGGMGILCACLGGGGISSFWKKSIKSKGKKKHRK